MKVFGHRGAAGEAPENTIAGFRHAIERGVRFIELDIQLSADNQLVVVHDDRVNRTTYSRGEVISFDAKSLSEMRANRAGPPWEGANNIGVPALDEVLDAVPEVEGYYWEVKTSQTSDIDLIVEKLAEKLSNPLIAEKVVVTSLNQKLLRRLAEQAPHVALGWITLRPDAMRELEKNKNSFQYLLLPWGLCNPMITLYAKKQGLKVAAWTVNDPQIIRNLYRAKIEAVITDYPSMAIPLLASITRNK